MGLFFFNEKDSYGLLLLKKKMPIRCHLMATSRVAIHPKLPAGTTGWVLQCIQVNDPRLDSCYDDCMVLMEFDVIDEYGVEIKRILVKDSYLEQKA
jgi:hypothetical protein